MHQSENYKEQNKIFKSTVKEASKPRSITMKTQSHTHSGVNEKKRHHDKLRNSFTDYTWIIWNMMNSFFKANYCICSHEKGFYIKQEVGKKDVLEMSWLPEAQIILYAMWIKYELGFKEKNKLRTNFLYCWPWGKNCCLCLILIFGLVLWFLVI